MLSFHQLTLADQARINYFSSLEDSRSADFNFGNMFLWDNTFHQLVADCDQQLVMLCQSHQVPFFPFPIGNSNLSVIIPEMQEYAEHNCFPFILRGLEARHVELLDHTFPNSFSFHEDRDYADYLYSIDNLIALSGKKYHGKRNHIAQFLSTYQWTFRAITPDDFPACKKLISRWASGKGDSDEVLGEEDALNRAFRYYNELNLIGGALFIEKELIAFAIGEQISSDTFDIHFEKAIPEINGAYPMINREFSIFVHEHFPSIHYVNREDDMGLDNLRKSKLSYYPDALLMKYSARME